MNYFMLMTIPYEISIYIKAEINYRNINAAYPSVN